MTFFQPLIDAWERLKTKLGPLGKTIWAGLQWAWENIFVPFGTWLATEAAPVFLDLLGAAAEALNKTLISLQPWAQWFWDNFLKPLADWTGKAIIDAMKWLTKWIEENPQLFMGFVLILGLIIGAFLFLAFVIGLLVPVVLFAGGVIAAIGAIIGALGAIFSTVGLIIMIIIGVFLLLIGAVINGFVGDIECRQGGLVSGFGTVQVGDRRFQRSFRNKSLVDQGTVVVELALRHLNLCTGCFGLLLGLSLFCQIFGGINSRQNLACDHRVTFANFQCLQLTCHTRLDHGAARCLQGTRHG
jgi:hypothetical protein